MRSSLARATSAALRGPWAPAASRSDRRRWLHKIANVLNKVPRSVQWVMKTDLREIHGAPTCAAAEATMGVFGEKYGIKYARALGCLTKDHAALLAFYDMPAEHWDHLRTTNPVESVFATVRNRTVRTKGALSPTTAKLMVFKLVMAASKTWRRLKGENQLPKVVAGVTFRDGTEVIAHPDHRAARPPPSPNLPHSSAKRGHGDRKPAVLPHRLRAHRSAVATCWAPDAQSRCAAQGGAEG